MITRNLERPLRSLAAQMPVVAVTGPRQSGKTTLCRSVFPSKPYVSLELLDVREFARRDPRGFLEEHRDGAILDEAQNAPDLFSYLQVDVDERPEPGRFVLTGSQHFGLSESISQSLAGRVALLYLLPPSLDELSRFPEPPEDLLTALWKGAYPRIFDRDLDAGRWLADYVSTYVQRDVRQVRNVTDLHAFTAFLRLTAGRTATELHLSGMGGDAGISHNTARSWLSVLESSFIAFRLPPWHRNLRKRAVKAPKIHFFDSGLACHLLGIREPHQLRHHPLRGAIFESWVAAEMYKSRANAALEPDLFHLRDDRGPEVDVILDAGSDVTAVECKAGATVAPDFFAGLEALRTRVERELPHVSLACRLVYGGEQGQRRGSVRVVPWRDVADFSR
jgi:predicted AAA+ superfamily ATPase